LGTTFKISLAGLATLHTFDGADGTYPATALLQAVDLNFYGTTVLGGASGNCAGGCGTVFKMTPGGAVTTLHSFDSADGSEPVYALIQGMDGNLYGTTFAGGASLSCVGGCGTIFKITPAGALTTLHSFEGPDGAEPLAGLVQDAKGNFYGTTYMGGASGYGTVFEFSSGRGLTTLHSFNNEDGANPYAGLFLAANGNFYGTTYAGGSNRSGTIFEITPDGVLTILYVFCLQGRCADGSTPVAGVIQAPDGNLYGTTIAGGTAGYGTIFAIAPNGGLTTLHSFDSTDGAQPYGGLLQATNGTFYGTTEFGGRDGASSNNCGVTRRCGTVFSLDMGLGPFVAFIHNSGGVGQTGGILGQGFTGTTSVSINGILASFTVVSDTFINATVPAGATTGYVTVVTPTGMLTSNVPFRVIP
jgi:uncharacterized repeat protein (TIGR03803 family)